MSNVNKKKEKLKQRIAELEFELRNTLQKKSQGAPINIQECNSKIMKLKNELNEL